MKPEIWLVEDDEYLGELTRTVLEKRGFIVKTFINGQDVLTAMTMELPDLIITDNFLPDQSGLEICRIVKSNPDTKHIPVIITTGQLDCDEIESSPDDILKPDGCLIKPFDIENLIILIQKSLPGCKN